MTNQGRPGFLRRAAMAVGSALQRAILGKSGRQYTKRLSGSDAYWDRAIAAQMLTQKRSDQSHELFSAVRKRST